MKRTDYDPEELLRHQDFVRGLARRLVLDEARADDVVQQTWVAALSNGPRRAAALRAWLGVVVRNLARRSFRSEARRRDREHRAARAESVPSTAEVVEREAARRAVVDAVFVLPEPWRTTIILRHLEGLPQREIARRMGVPVETVHTRLRRGLDLLRELLDTGHGGRRAWCLPLIPFAAQPTGAAVIAPAVTTFLVGVAAVSLKVKISLAAVVLGATGVWLFVGPGPDRPDVPHEGVVAGDPAVGPRLEAVDAKRTVMETEAAADATVPSTEAPGATAGVDTGDLLISAVFAEDRTSAVGVGIKVYCWAEPDPYFSVRRLITDERGQASITQLSPGRLSIFADRGGMLGAKVLAGEQTDVILEIPPGMSVNGLVVDGDQRPVEGAAVIITNQGLGADGFVVAHSAADGTFRVRSIKGMCYIGARAAGFAPSKLPMLLGGAGSEQDVTLVLDERGGAIAGRVLGPAERPLHGVVVVIDPDRRENTRLQDGTQALASIELRSRTDVNGDFRFSGVAPGPHELGVRAPRLAPWRGGVDVLVGSTVRSEVRLLEGAVLVGKVVDSLSRPVARAEILAGDRSGFESAFAVTSATGEYRLEGLPPGLLELRVESDDLGKAGGQALMAAGVETRWDARLSLGSSIIGRVVDDADRPLAKSWVQAERSRGGMQDYFRGDAVTGADGRFVIGNCPDAPLELKVHAPGGSSGIPSVVRKNVRPGPSELVVRVPAESMPSVRLRGRVVDSRGEPLSGADASAWSSTAGGTGIVFADEKTGAFEIGPVPPGPYCVTVHVEGYPYWRSELRSLEATETWDLGDIRFEPAGFLLVRLRLSPGCSSDTLSTRIRSDHEGRIHRLNGEGMELRSEPLASGRYHLQLTAPNIVAQSIPFDIRAGEHTTLEPFLESGPASVIRVLESTASDRLWLRLRITDQAGEFALDTFIHRAQVDESFEYRLSLTEGHYTVEVGEPEGQNTRQTFDVGTGVEGNAVTLTLP